MQVLVGRDFAWTAELAAHAGVDHVDRLGAQVFGKLQVFMEPQACGGVISPQIVAAFPLREVADGVLPLDPVPERQAFDDTAAREPQKGRGEIRSSCAMSARTP